MSPITRREFLGTVLAGAGGMWLQTVSEATQKPPLRSPTEQVALGKTGIKASFVGIGTGMRGWMRQSNHTRMGKEAFIALIRHAYERGINFFDTADLYGTHPFLREALKGIPRDKVVIQSKIWFAPHGLPEQVIDARRAIDRFRQELGTDYIDIVLLHCTTSPTWTEDLRPMREALEEARQKGLIRAHGTSCHSLPALKAAQESPWVQVQLARINHRGTAMDGSPQEIAALLRQMRAAGKGVTGMKVFGEGRFLSPQEREESLRFLLSQRCVDNCIIGFEQKEQIDETLGILQRLLTG
ncbi:MAG: aldo/keto reductase [Armatimonadota bacterium]|nr:aldo/keto reductase [bacterium]MCS7309016.1 aldo/keto reductase [Armatimonadota bacterium]MDW8104520.1 aldo/keto reductase [Armatimonadota bacterium]MDW8289097.1 aldo/keto reductase [Armatimonadota bacterium]